MKLTEEGTQYAVKGTPEIQLVNLMSVGEKKSKVEIEELLGKDIAKVACNQAMKNKWMKSDKTHVERIVAEVEDAN